MRRNWRTTVAAAVGMTTATVGVALATAGPASAADCRVIGGVTVCGTLYNNTSMRMCIARFGDPCTVLQPGQSSVGRINDVDQIWQPQKTILFYSAGAAGPVIYPPNTRIKVQDPENVTCSDDDFDTISCTVTLGP